MTIATTDDARTQLESFLEIDDENLPDEWIRQPKLIFDVRMRSARARAAANEAELDRRIIESELFRQFKESAAQKDVRAPSDETCKHLIRTTTKWQKAEREYIELEERAAVWEGLVRAVEARGFSLRELAFFMGHDIPPENTSDTRRATAVQRKANDAFNKLRPQRLRGVVSTRAPLTVRRGGGGESDGTETEDTSV